MLCLSPSFSAANCRKGGEGGIRTHETRKGPHAFEACALNRSATSPRQRQVTPENDRERQSATDGLLYPPHRAASSRWRHDDPKAPRARVERAAFNLGGCCSIHLSYRGARRAGASDPPTFAGTAPHNRAEPFRRLWYAGRDLNAGPPPPQGGALSAELPAHVSRLWVYGAPTGAACQVAGAIPALRNDVVRPSRFERETPGSGGQCSIH